MKKTFEDLGSEINPLCLIQLPNADAGETKREVVEVFLADKGITESNGRLGVWLSGHKSDFLDDIHEPSNEIEFLIFKQAIDTGWDCPRAHILLKLREPGNEIFEIQTVGRILRMPEQKHYEDEKLNRGYIFTNSNQIIVEKEEYNPNIIKYLKATRKDIYNPLQLPSYYKSRVDFGDITSSFYKVLEKTFCERLGIDEKCTLVEENKEKLREQGMYADFKAYEDSILKDVKLETKKFDEIHGQIPHETTDIVNAKLSDNDLLDTFNQVIKDNLSGFAPKRSTPTVREALYRWFRKYLGIQPYSNGLISIQNIFLHPKNITKLSQLLITATGDYKPLKKEEVKRKIEETIYDWDMKEKEFFNQHTDEKLNYKLCIYDPCYLNIDRSAPEKEFEKYLETLTNKVEWWYKNGTNKKDFFGIKYMKNDLPQTFYPDYIIQFKSGKTGIFDTKAGRTAEDAVERAEALQTYVKVLNQKGKNLTGGIVTNDKKDNTGHWRVHRKAKYKFDPNDFREWEFFNDMDKTGT